MSFYIKDPRVAEMGERLRTLTDAASKSEAVLKAEAASSRRLSANGLHFAIYVLA
jgi:hypothetical protein